MAEPEELCDMVCEDEPVTIFASAYEPNVKIMYDTDDDCEKSEVFTLPITANRYRSPVADAAVLPTCRTDADSVAHLQECDGVCGDENVASVLGVKYDYVKLMLDADGEHENGDIHDAHTPSDIGEDVKPAIDPDGEYENGDVHCVRTPCSAIDDSVLSNEVPLCDDELSDESSDSVIKCRRKRKSAMTIYEDDDDLSDEDLSESDHKSAMKRRNNPKRQRLKVKRNKKSSKNSKKQSKESTGPGRFRCSSCEFVTNNSQHMHAHTLDHKVANNTCYYCELRLDSLELLEDHVLQCHSDADTAELPFTCHECSMKFRTHTWMMLHMQKHSNEKPYVCAICEASFKGRKSLLSHSRIHTGEQHLCDFCGYSTTRREQLQLHRRVHTGETLRCTQPGCDFLTTVNKNLKAHMLTHMEQRPYLQCEVCGQNFARPNGLKRHMLYHSDTAEKHRCEYCDYSTLRYGRLKEHLYSKHQVGTPPAGRRMTTNELVKKYHSNSADPGLCKAPGSEPTTEALQCAECGRCFVNKRNLKRHMLVNHTENAEKHQCEHCEYATARYDRLTRHLFNKHKIVSAPKRFCPRRMENANGTSNVPPAPPRKRIRPRRPPKPTLTRISFSADERAQLTAEFELNPNPNGAEADRIAERLGVARQRVQDWFHNTRAQLRKRHKKQLQQQHQMQQSQQPLSWQPQQPQLQQQWREEESVTGKPRDMSVSSAWM